MLIDDASGQDPAVSIEPSARRILVAEDYHVDESIIGAMLMGLGHHVDFVPDGRDAIAAVLRSPYDLVLMDIQMPHVNGHDAARQIRALTGAEAAVPIVAMTADATPEQQKQWLADGMNGYLAKPVHRRALERVIAQFAQPPGSAPNADLPAGQLVPEMTTIPVLDKDILVEFADLVGWEAMASLCETLEIDFRARCEQMNLAAACGDFTELGCHAHSLKSATGQFGARQAQQTAEKIDALCKAGQGDAAGKLVPALLWQGDTALIELAEIIAANSIAQKQKA
jgi:CheY-like chemotaxis protein/HPt (histidine-containing phosphotransfer) domain-containing protein